MMIKMFQWTEKMGYANSTLKILREFTIQFNMTKKCLEVLSKDPAFLLSEGSQEVPLLFKVNFSLILYLENEIVMVEGEA